MVPPTVSPSPDTAWQSLSTAVDEICTKEWSQMYSRRYHLSGQCQEQHVSHPKHCKEFFQPIAADAHRSPTASCCRTLPPLPSGCCQSHSSCPLPAQPRAESILTHCNVPSPLCMRPHHCARTAAPHNRPPIVVTEQQNCWGGDGSAGDRRGTAHGTCSMKMRFFC